MTLAELAIGQINKKTKVLSEIKPRTNKQAAWKWLCPFACTLRVNKDQDIVQIYNTKTFALAKEQYGLSK